MPLYYDPAAHDAEPLTEQRIAATLDRLSRLEQACNLIGDGNETGGLNLLVGAALVALAGFGIWVKVIGW